VAMRNGRQIDARAMLCVFHPLVLSFLKHQRSPKTSA
jgi:hypothetical protein